MTQTLPQTKLATGIDQTYVDCPACGHDDYRVADGYCENCGHDIDDMIETANLIETMEAQDAAIVAAQVENAARFDAMWNDLAADWRRRVDETRAVNAKIAAVTASVRRIECQMQDADFGFAEPVEFVDCPKCDDELAYAHDTSSKRSVCLTCLHTETDADRMAREIPRKGMVSEAGAQIFNPDTGETELVWQEVA